MSAPAMAAVPPAKKKKKKKKRKKNYMIFLLKLDTPIPMDLQRLPPAPYVGVHYFHTLT
jgi:hypothetical protein